MTSEAADLVLINGRVLTMDRVGTVAQAVAISGGSLVAVGTNDGVRGVVGPRTEVVDGGGRTVLPGINDSHLHACAFGVNQPPLSVDVSYPAVRSLADVRAVVAAAATRAPRGEWIRGNGWDLGYLEECRADSTRLPSAADLDAVSPHHPVYLQDFSGHMTWGNSRALELAAIDEDSTVEGGVIVKDAAGIPTGLLQEGAQHLLQRVVPPLTRADRERAIRTAIRTLHGEGITSYTEPGLGPGGDTLFGGALGGEALDVYADLARAGELPIRVSTLLLFSGMSGGAAEIERGLASYRYPTDLDPRLLRVLGVKIFADGIPPNKTAWMSEEYAGGGHGSLCVHGATDGKRNEELDEMIRLAHEAGHQVGVHVTGDLGIDAVVDAFAKAVDKHPRTDPRHYVIHGDFVGARSLAKMARFGFGVNMNPTVKWTIADLMTEMLAEQRSAYQWPVRTAMQAGVVVAASSDAPVTFPNWRQGVAGMILRESKASGKPVGPEECVSLDQALRAYTINAAWQDFAEDWKGSLEAGKVADICVVDGDLQTADPHDIPDIPVAMTIFDGRVVFDSSR